MAKKVKGNFTQNPNRLQKEFFVPCEVFKNEKERMESGFPSENCRYGTFLFHLGKEHLLVLSKPE